MNNLIIRPLLAEDLNSAKDVIDSTGLFPSEMLDEMANAFLTASSPDDLWIVALREDVVVGLVYCAPERMTDKTWNLLLIAVQAAQQGQGVGSQLTRCLEDILSEKTGRVLIVETSSLPLFDRTRAVYLKLDYVEVARIPEFYAAGEDKVVFWKALPN